MEKNRGTRVWTFAGALALALTVGALARRSTQAPAAPEEMRDAVAAPISPAALGGARVVAPDKGWFASPAGRRAEAERALTASRPEKGSKAARSRAARLRREAARERALSVTAQ
ncbi:MAG: hypothetical protein NDJ72_13860 [Elusimicrobia bacterium]|nr:hypothetical protein [Elusimicrobiota bacterium]